jgi:hypothetical protein
MDLIAKRLASSHGDSSGDGHPPHIDAEASRLVLDLAKHVISQMQANCPGWKNVYVRFCAPSDSQHGWNASYVTETGVELISPFRHRTFNGEIMRIGPRLRELLANKGGKFCVFLLRADSKFDYHIDFEWHDPEKWVITKLNGKSGLPEGFEAE